MLYSDTPWPEQPAELTTDVLQERTLYQSKVFGVSLDDFRMPRDRIELLTSNIAVAAAKLRTEEERCEDDDSIVVTLPSASSHINPILPMQERESPLEIAQAQPLSSTASSPGPLTKVIPLSDPLIASTLVPVPFVPVAENPITDKSEVTPMPTTEEQSLRNFVPVQSQQQMGDEWLTVHADLQENYHDTLRWHTQADIEDHPQRAVIPQWMNRLPEAYKQFYIRYAEKNSGRVMDDMLAVHTQNTFEKYGLGWRGRYQMFDLGDRVTTFVSTNAPPGVPSVGGEAAQETVLRWAPSTDVMRHLCLDSRGVHLMSLLR